MGRDFLSHARKASASCRWLLREGAFPLIGAQVSKDFSVQMNYDGTRAQSAWNLHSMTALGPTSQRSIPAGVLRDTAAADARVVTRNLSLFMLYRERQGFDLVSVLGNPA